jgi:hypothetical protein
MCSRKATLRKLSISNVRNALTVSGEEGRDPLDEVGRMRLHGISLIHAPAQSLQCVGTQAKSIPDDSMLAWRYPSGQAGQGGGGR